MLSKTANLVPPSGAFQTPSWGNSSTLCCCCFFCDDGSNVPLAAKLPVLGTPGGVSLDGGSTVRIDTSLSSRPESTSMLSSAFCVRTSHSDTASAESATASSSLDGSNRMLSPTATTSSVMGGLEPAAAPWRGYRNGEASQSSSNMGSSSPSDLRRGSLVERRARCVVRERRGRGYDSGGDIRMICEHVSKDLFLPKHVLFLPMKHIQASQTHIKIQPPVKPSINPQLLRKLPIRKKRLP